MSPMREAFIGGAAVTRWDYYENAACHEFGSRAVVQALDDAGMQWKDVQAVFCGSVYQGTGSGHQAIREVGLTGIPIINVENACSSAASAFMLAYQLVAAQVYDVVLAMGMEKMPRGPIPSTAFRDWELNLGFNLQPANYALLTRKYMEKTGASEEDFSLVTVKNRANGALNPNARFREPVSLDQVMNSRLIAVPLRLLHCCPLADGAAAFVVCGREKLKRASRAVRIAASVLTSACYGDEYPPGDLTGSVRYPSSENLVGLSARNAFDIAGMGPGDIDLLQVYDTVAPGELWDIEELGFCGEGEAPGFLRDGVFNIGGRLPVNTDGGLLSRGHPLGASAGGQLYELVLQLRGEAGPRQVAGARAGLAHSMGAGPNSAVTILVK